jgi:hypothetical protein
MAAERDLRGEARLQKNGVLEYWNIGVLGLEAITPSLHYSSLNEAVERNDAHEG